MHHQTITILVSLRGAFKKFKKSCPDVCLEERLLEGGQKEGEASQRHCNLADRTSTLGEARGDPGFWHLLTRQILYIKYLRKLTAQKSLSFPSNTKQSSGGLN